MIILIEKARTIPLKILILQALLRRLPLSHPKYPLILEELKRREAGYQGEESLDFYFRSLSKNRYMIFHDLNLPDGEYNCQIDTLLATSEKILLIDAKNYKSNLTFDTDNEQFSQNNNGIEKGFAYPIAQAERHRKYMIDFLADHHLPPIPVDYLVVFTNQYATYMITGKNTHLVRPRVCKSDVLLNRIKAFENLYKDSVATPKELRKLSRLLNKMNTPPTGEYLKKYGIEQFELLTGVHCPNYSHLPMIREKRKWFCPACGTFSKDAHVEALLDYFLLYGLTITNKQFRDFAHLHSIDTAGRILRTANLSFSGNNRHRVYFPPKIPW